MIATFLGYALTVIFALLAVLPLIGLVRTRFTFTAGNVIRAHMFLASALILFGIASVTGI